MNRYYFSHFFDDLKISNELDRFEKVRIIQLQLM